jgi:radical SAM superfamily enzyme YgiQ (UPF0313 family)
MKILFVNPSCLDPRITSDDARVVPIGIYYMAALLLDKGLDAQILNLASLDGDKESLKAFNETIEREKPDLIGFSVTNPNRINAVACAKEAKKRLPQACILFGGPAPTFMAAHLFTVCPQVDIMVQGEGESTLLAIVQALANGNTLKEASIRKIKGIALWKNGCLVETGPCDPIADLDSLPHPSQYFVYQHLAMSRGCPGKCTFCGSPKFWGSHNIRCHSALWFAEEIKTLARKGVTHFFISDDTFTMDRNRVIELCQLLIAADLHITWNAISRVDYIDKELLFWMRLAGCIQISFGVESGSQKIKKLLGKPISNEACVQAFALTISYGIMARAYFIYGSPGETDETIKESCDLLIQLNPLGTIFYLLVIYPGTHLYRKALQKKLITDEIWHREMEDLPWFELDETLDFPRVKAFGDRLRNTFFDHLPQFVSQIDLVADERLYPFHADFLSRLAMTFAHGEYANDPRIKTPGKIAEHLFTRALSYSPDPRAFMGIAMVLQKQKQFSKATFHLTKGLDHFPGNKDLSVCMGVCHMNQNRFKKALPFFIPFRDDPGIAHYITICNSQEKTP